MTSKKKRTILWLSPIVTVALLALWGRARIAEVESDALLLATTGQAAIKLFKEIGAGLAAGDLDRVLAAYSEDARGRAEGLWNEQPAGERDGVESYRWRVAPVAGGGAVDTRLLFEDLVARLGTVESAKLKLASVEEIPAPGKATVRSHLWIRSSGADGRRMERRADLRMWLVEEADGWRVRRQALLGGETVIGRGTGFVDVAETAGIDHRTRQDPRFDTPEWNPERFEIIRYGVAGVSVGDYDGDGWEDLYFGDGAAPRLYRARGDGTFEDATRAAGLPAETPASNVGLFADFDNDGDRDLFAGGFTGPNRLYENRGDGTFADVTEEAGVGGLLVTVAAAADYDGDGLLDLYVGRYLDPRTELPTTLFHTRNGAGNSLLRNVGGLRFVDVTEEAGVREGGLTLGVAWADYDVDGDPDLYVANDFGRNALFRNDGDGTFTDVAAESGALDFGYGMSADWGDVDNDGDLDIYVSNVHSGQRWYGQAPSLYRYLLTSVRQGTLVEDLPIYREIFHYVGSGWKEYGEKVVKGNSLLLNDGDGSFVDVAEAARANPYGWYWGSGFFDYDNDGRLDLYAGNGWITAPSQDDL